MLQHSSKGILAAALLPILSGLRRVLEYIQGRDSASVAIRSANDYPCRGNSQTKASRAFAWSPLETLEGRALLSGGGLVQPFELKNADTSDSVYDTLGNLHVAFRDSASLQLKYTMRSADGTWSPVTVVDNQEPDTGFALSIAMAPTGNPAIAYYAGQNDDLKYAESTGSSWDLKQVDQAGDVGRFTSLTFNSNGFPFIAYYDATNTNLKVARRLSALGGTWSVDTVHSSANDVGRECSIAAIADRYGIVYRDQTANKLKYLQNTASGIYDIRDLVTGTAGQNYFSDTAIAVDSSSTPAVAYYDNNAHKVAYLKRSGGVGTAWTATDIDTGVNSAPSTNLVINSSGGIEVAYYKTQTGAANDEAWVKRWDGLTWRAERMLIGGALTLSFSENPNGNFTIVAGREGTVSGAYVNDWNRDLWVGVYEYLYNNIGYSVYRGAMKGAQATLDTRFGDDWDQASLLIRELAKVGVEGKYVDGTIAAPSADVQKWLGVVSAENADAILDGLKTNSETDYAQLSTDELTFTSIPHVWVQATTYSATGPVTKTLDTSWKLKDLSAGIASTLTTVPFSIYDDGDLALSRSATGSAHPGYEASKAVDGDPDTSWWVIPTQDEPQPVLSLDLGAVFDIDRVRIEWASGLYASRYSIDTSMDGVSWGTLKFKDGDGDGGVDDWTVLGGTNPALARWVRITCITPGQLMIPGFSIADLRVYGYNDFAVGHGATASSSDIDPYTPVHADDGDAWTQWRSAAGGTQWIQFDVGKVVNVCCIHLKWGTGYANAYNVQISDNGTTWRPIWNEAAGNGQVDDITGLATQGEYVKINLTGLTGDTVYSLYDFQIYDTPKTEELPINLYEAKVRDYLARTSPGESTAHAPLDGPTPHHQFTTSTPSPSYSIVTSTAASGTIPANNKQRVGVTLAAGAVSCFGDFLLNSADLAGQAISIAYPASGHPELQADGVVLSSCAGTIATGTTVKLTLNEYSGDGNTTSENQFVYDSGTRTAGQSLGIGLQSEQMSGSMLASFYAKLNAKALAAFSDSSKNADYQNLLVGVMAAVYLGEVDSANDTLAIMDGLVNVRWVVGSGVVTGDPAMETHWDLSTPIFSPKTWFDMRGLEAGLAAASSVGLTSDQHNAAVLLFSYTTSALENAVLSRFLNAPAVSTWEGFKLANRKAIPIYEIWFQNGQTVYRPIEPATQPLTFDWDTMLSVGSAQKTAMQKDVITDLKHIFAPISSVTIGDWTGAVWARGATDANGFLTKLAMVIVGPNETEAHGSELIGQIAPAQPIGSSLNDWSTVMGDPVEVSNGNMHHQEVDLAIPNVGFPLKLERNYNSLSSDDAGMGPGWSYTFSDKLTYDGSKITWQTAEGVRHEFSLDSSGVYRSLGMFGDFERPSPAPPSGDEYFYRERNGVSYHFDYSTGKLKQIDDANGQGIKVTQGANGPTRIEDLKDSTRFLSISYNGNNKIGSISDFTGRTWNYTYSTLYTGSAYYLTAASLNGSPDLLSMTYGYNTATLLADPRSGLLTSITDNNDNGTHTYEYYTNRKAFRVTDSEGNQESFFYDLFNHVTRHVDMRGVSTSFGFKSDGLGLTQTVFNPDGTRFDNEWTGPLISANTDEIGRRETFQYLTGTGDVSAHMAMDGLQTSYQYLSGFNRITQAAVGSRITDYTYSTTGDLLTQAEHNGSQALITSFAYPGTNNRGLPTARTDPKGNVQYPDANYTTNFTYNAAGQLLTETSHPTTGGDIVRSYSYDNKGFKTSEGIRSGVSNTVTGLNRSGGTAFATTLSDHGYVDGDLVEIHGANEWEYNGFFTITVTGSKTFTYAIPTTAPTSATGTIASETTVSGTIYAYDAVGHLLTISKPDPDGSGPLGQLVTTNVYKAGNLVSVTDPNGNKTTYTYDRIERMFLAVAADGGRTMTRYDGLGNIIDTKDPLGQATVILYDNRNRPIETIYANDTSKHIRYDAVGRVVSTTDERAFSSAISYDSGNRVTRTIDALGQFVTHRYNEMGELIESVDWGISDPIQLSSGDLPIVAVGNFDGNGYSDLIRYSATSGQFELEQKEFGGTYALERNDFPDATTTNWRVAGVADVNDDGIDDIVWQNTVNLSKHQVWFMSATGKVVSANPYSPDWASSLLVGVGDVDGDGDADSLWRNAAGTAFRWYIASTSGGSTTWTPDGAIVDNGEVPTAVGDLNGDGLAREIFASISGWTIQAVGDIDGDGTDDMLWHNTTTGGNTLWLFKPNTHFSQIVLEADLTRTVVAIADYRGDGNVDLIWSDFTNGSSGFSELGRRTFTLDSLGRVTQERGPAGSGTTYDYDENGNRVTTTSYDFAVSYYIPSDPRPGNRSTTVQFDAVNRPVQVTDPNAKNSYSSYDKANRLTATTDELGRVTTYSYDRAGRLTGKILPDPDGTGPLASPTENYTLDAVGNVIAISDPLLHVSKYSYDPVYRKTGQFGMSGTSFTGTGLTRTGSMATATTLSPHGYSSGDVVEISNASDSGYNGVYTIAVTTPTTFTFTVGGTPATSGVTAAAQKATTSTRYTYDIAGNTTSTFDALGNKTTSTYDNRNRDTGDFSMSNTIATVSSLTWSSSTGLATATSTAHGLTTGDVIEIRGATQAQYNGFSSITVVDANTFTFAVAGTPVTPATGTIVAEKTLQSLRRQFDAAGNLLQTTGALGNVTDFEYDAMNHQTKIKAPDPDGAGPQARPETATTYQFNHVTKITDPLMHDMSYAYDSAGHKISETSADPDGSGPLASSVVRYTYDGFGNLKTIVDALGNVTSYTYDKLDRILSETGADPDANGPLLAPVTGYTYDAVGNLLSTTDPTSKVQTNSYDRLNRIAAAFWTVGTTKAISNITRSGTIATAASSNNGYSSGDIVEIRGANEPEFNGFFKILLADATGFSFIVSSSIPSSATGTSIVAEKTVSGTRYDYDLSSNLAGETDSLDNRTSYTYDVLDRNTSVTQPDPDGAGVGAPAPVTNYAYDANSNVITTTDLDGHVTQSSYDKLNRQTGTFLLDASANAKTISSITRINSTAKVTTSANHGYLTGDVIRISGANQPEYNGFFVITVPTGSTTQFTYTVTGSPTTPATIAPGQSLQALKSTQSSRQAYDAASRLTGNFDGQNNKTSYSYDNDNRKTGEYVMVGSSKLIGGITRSGTVATVTLNNHGYVVGNVVNITGADQSQYNGSVTITGVMTNTFTYTVTGNPVTPATGTLVSEKLVQSATLSGSTVTVTSNSHGFSSGNVVEIRGANQPQYNGFFAVNVTDTNTFTYTINGTPATPATGAIVAENTVESTRYTYDAGSNLKSVKDGSSNVTEFSYDNLDRQSSESTMARAITNLSCSGSLATAIAIAHGYVTNDVVTIAGADQAQFNGSFPITKVDNNKFTYPVTSCSPTQATGSIVAERNLFKSTAEYDTDGNVIASTDHNGLRRHFVHDKLNRLTEEHWLAPSVTISSVSYADITATITTSANHGFSTGDLVEISDVSPGAYDGQFQITVINPTTFTYVMASSPGASASGFSMNARKILPKVMISTVTANGTLASVTTATQHGYNDGDIVEMSGIDQSDYNGMFQIDVTGVYTFNYTMYSAPGSPATGSAMAARKWLDPVNISTGGYTDITANVTTSGSHNYITGDKIEISGIN